MTNSGMQQSQTTYNPGAINAATRKMEGGNWSSARWNGSTHNNVQYGGGLRYSNGAQQRTASTGFVTVVPQINIQTNAYAPAVEAVNGNIQINQGQQNLTLFSSANQVLQGARGQVIGGAPGTMIERERNYVILHKGRITMQSGQEASVVRTRMGEVKLNPETIAIIDDQPEKSLRVIAVTGRENAVTVTGPICQGKELSARSGQELILSSKGIEDEELIPAEGAEIMITGAIEKKPQVARAKATLPRLFELPSASRAGKQVHLSSAGKMMSNTDRISNAKIWDLLDPKADSPMQIVAEAGSKFQQLDGTLKLLNGTIFVQAKSDMTVETPFLKAEAKRNALLMLQSEASTSRIKAFSGPEDLTVRIGKSNVELVPGQELIVSTHELSKDELNPADFVARRVRSTSHLQDGVHHAINEFSITSMLHYPGYRNMIARSDRSGKLTDKILKTAVVVEMVTRSHGQYAYSGIYEQQQQLVKADEHKISSAEIK